MKGIVLTANFGFAHIRTPDFPQQVCAHASQMPCDDLGRHFLLPGEEVTFELSYLNGRPIALQVELVNPRPVENLRGYFEEGPVRNLGRTPAVAADEDESRNRRNGKNGEWCFVLRPFGGVAYLHWRNVRSMQTSPMSSISFFVGQRWQYEIKPPLTGDDNRPWQAVNAVEICET